MSRPSTVLVCKSVWFYIKSVYISEICKKIFFYCHLDEEIFFDWIKRIKCIAKFEGAGDELYLDLIEGELDYEDMKDLIALCYRYKIKMDQLEKFINENNRPAVEPWIKKIRKK